MWISSRITWIIYFYIYYAPPPKTNMKTQNDAIFERRYISKKKHHLWDLCQSLEDIMKFIDYIQAHCNISLDQPSPLLFFNTWSIVRACWLLTTQRTKYSKSILNSGYLNGFFQRLLTSSIENCTNRDIYLGTRNPQKCVNRFMQTQQTPQTYKPGSGETCYVLR